MLGIEDNMSFFKEMIIDYENELIIKELIASNGNIAEAAVNLGLERTTLGEKIKIRKQLMKILKEARKAAIKGNKSA